MPRILLLLALVCAVAVYAFRDRLATSIVTRAVQNAMSSSALDTLPEGLHVAVCGAGSPMPDPKRSGPCLAVIAGDTLVIVDAGSGGVRNLQRMNISPGAISAVFLTHFHSDHIDGLGELAMLRWVQAAHTEPLRVYGPRGVNEVVEGFNRAYRQDAGYRTAHHGPTVAPSGGAGMRAEAFLAPADGTPLTVLDAAGLRVSAFAVDHAPAAPAVGYRFDYGGRSLVISGDTKKNAAVAAEAKGADLLVHEGLAPHLVGILAEVAGESGQAIIARITHDILDYHASPVEAAEIAAAAGVKALLFYHVVPPLQVPGMEAAYLRGVSDVYGGDVVISRDGTLASLPAGGAAIRFAELL